MTSMMRKGGALITALVSKSRKLHDPRIGVTAAIVGAVALAIVTGPEVRTDDVWYDMDGRLLVSHEVAPGELSKPRGVTVVAGSASKLYKDFHAIGYKLDDVRSGSLAVPRVYVKAMPRDIRSMSSVETRKQIFIKAMLPLILRVNEELRQTRARIQELTGRVVEGGVLTAREQTWLDAQYQRHDVDPGNAALLLRRVDVIPPSLALAQAAEESGWGTSRFALEGRALFGQRTHSEGDGLVPEAHAEDAGIRVKSFDALLDGVRSYARNLNTHAAYAEFRRLRAQMRRTARTPVGLNSMRLVETLKNYSERGMDYVQTIKTIIRVNNLREFDGAKLSENAVPAFTRSG